MASAMWWSAWLLMWAAIALCQEIGEQCSYPYMRAFAQNKLTNKGFHEMKNYVQEREEALKAEFQAKMAYNRFIGMWEVVGLAMDHKRNAEYYMAEYNKIRAEYIRKGRKPGYSPKAKEAA